MADRSVSVRIKADVDQYRRDMARAADATEKVADAAEDVGDQAPAVKRVGEEAKKTGRQLAQIEMDRSVAVEIRRAGEALDDATTDAQQLDRAIDSVTAEVDELRRALLRTGDVDALERLRERGGVLRQLQRMRREVSDLGEDVEEVGRGLTRSIGDTLAAIPPRLRGALIVGVVGAAAALLPLLGAVIAAAVVGGVGAGGIAGGIVAAADDPRVAAAAQSLVAGLNQEFQQLGDGFVDPVTDALSELRQAGRQVLSQLAPDIDALAPVVRELAQGIGGLAREAVPGIRDALRAAEPILRTLAAELPELGDAFGDMLSTISEESDGAQQGLLMLLRITGDLLRATGEIVAFWSRAFEDLAEFGQGAATVGAVLSRNIPIVGGLFAKAQTGAEQLRAGLDETGEEGEEAGEEIGRGFATAAERIDAANQVLLRHRDLLRAQTDPIFALIQAQQRNTEAQREYNEAVEEHGRDSAEAKEALLGLAEAAVDMQGAAAEAAGVLGNKMDPRLRAVFEAAGLSKGEMRRLGDAFDDAREAGEDFSGDYFANIRVTTKFRTEGNPPPFGLGSLPNFAGQNFAFQHGGRVDGPPGVDRVPAMLSDEEHVWTAREVRAAGGHDAVEAMRAAVLAGQTRHAVPATTISSGRAAGADAMGSIFIDNHIEIGGEVVRVVRTEITAHDRGIKRAVLAGTGAAR